MINCGRRLAHVADGSAALWRLYRYTGVRPRKTAKASHPSGTRSGSPIPTAPRIAYVALNAATISPGTYFAARSSHVGSGVPPSVTRTAADGTTRRDILATSSDRRLRSHVGPLVGREA